MNFSDLRVGMKLSGNYRDMGFQEWVRVEAIGCDWAVVRGENGRTWFINDSGQLCLYHDEKIT